MTTTLHTRAMLARLSISAWTARKHDKSVSAEVEATHGAHDAGRFNKLLVSKALLEPLAKLGGEVRKYHYANTLPWNDGGDRLLPSILFMAYTDQIREFKRQFAKLVSELTHAYPAEVQTARNRLGSMYNPADYPDVSELYGRFDISIEFEPIPNAKDFRVDVSDEAADEIRNQITNSVNLRQQEAVKDCYRRVREVVSKIHERLSVEDAMFRDTLIENARDLMAVLPGLNITDDPALTALHGEINELLMVEPTTLRNSPTKRKETADAADAILAKLPWA